MTFNLVRYSQQDPRWKDDRIGKGPGTIGYLGCALTSLAMYTSGWGFTETPGTLNKKLTARNGFVGEAIVWAAVTQIYPQIKSNGLTLCYNTNAPLAQIDASLAEGQPMIVEVDYSPAPGLQTHWVLLYARQGSDYLILDPWPYPSDTGEVTLLSRFGHGRSLGRAIKAIAWYECTAVGAPVPAEGVLYVRPLPSVTAGLRLRTQPSLESYPFAAEMPGTLLQVLEEENEALAKIGKMEKWLYILDPQGRRGYVAAWLVEKAEAAAPAPSSPPEPQPPPGEPQRFQVAVSRRVGRAGLVVRSQPSPGASQVHIEKAGARLTVLEPIGTAIPKIGAAGQWLAVKATNNQRGYVMAQYVELRV